MKIAILAAGMSYFFPLFIDKPKCLYHLNGKIQLQRVIEDAKEFVDAKDIIVVGGYKAHYLKRFLKKYPEITLKVNDRYRESAIYSFRKAAEKENDDIVFMLGDESISRENIKKICESKRQLAIMCHDTFYYYSLGIIKLRKDVLGLLFDDKYLSMETMKEIYCFANRKKEYDGSFDINSGICLGYIFIDLIRTIGDIKTVENPMESYKGKEIDFIHYNPSEEYIPDLDRISDTDEYKKSLLLRFYSDRVTPAIKRCGRAIRRMIK